MLSLVAGLIFTAASASTYAQSNVEKSTGPSATEKAVNYFDGTFGTTVLPTVVTTDKGIIILSAEIANRPVTSVFTKKGNLVYSLTRYPAASLAKDVIELVEKNYDTRGFYITHMEKVDQPGSSAVYLVHLKGADSFKTLRVSNDEIEEVENLQSA